MNEHLLLVEGYESIGRQPWRLALLELIRSGADGREVCRQLRIRQANTPVIMRSARSAEAHRVPGLELGADDHIAKPCSTLAPVVRRRALRRRVRQMRSTPTDPGLTHQVGKVPGPSFGSGAAADVSDPSPANAFQPARTDACDMHTQVAAPRPASRL